MSGKHHIKRLLGELARLALASETGDLSILVDNDALSPDEQEALHLVRQIIENHRAASESALAEKAEAQAANQAKSAFLAGMSHELRTPMNAIMGITEMQLQNTSLPQEAREALGRIYISGDLLLNIINDILDFSKIESGKLELVLSEYEVAGLINDAIQINVIQYEYKPIEFEIEIDPNTPSQLYGDELRIRQTLGNLLSNAFKYTDEGKVSLAVFAETGKEADTVTLIFQVSDSGQGMTPGQLKRLFDENALFNYRAERTSERTGLGMSITQNLMRMMDGELMAESAPGKGSVFTVRLPQKQVNSNALGNEVVENLRKLRFGGQKKPGKSQIIYEPMPYGRVLLVDDVESNLYAAKMMLQPYGLQIETVRSGAEAVERIRNGDVYDIVFMDYMMPEMNGMEAAKRIREMGYTYPIAAMTANALAGQEEVFLANGFDAYIPKPVDTRLLNATLNELVRDKHAGDESTDTPSLRPEADHRLIEIFMRDAGNAVSILRSIREKQGLLNEKDMDLYVTTIIGMKNALARIDEHGLAGAASALETAGREHDTARIDADTPVFLHELRKVMERIAPPKEAEEAGIQYDSRLLCEKLLVFQAACAVDDTNTARTALVDLGEMEWPYQVKRQLDEIFYHFLYGQYEKAADMAAEAVKMVR